MKNKYILKILFSFFLVLTFAFSANEALANEIKPDQYFNVEYTVGRQSVWNNSIPIDIYVIPLSNFRRVEISFDHSSMVDVIYSGPQFFPVEAGETYKVQARIHPKEPGIHHVTANAIAWEHDTNYTTSFSDNVEVDERLQIVPQTQAYKILNFLKNVFIILAIVGIIAGIYLLIIKNMDKIKNWFEPEY